MTENTPAADLLDPMHGMPAPIRGECFRSYLSRYLKNTGAPASTVRGSRISLLRHFREAGLDVEASAAQCITAIRMYRLGLGQ